MPMPTKKTDKVVEEVLKRLSLGEPLSAICRSHDKFPSRQVWMDWCDKDESLRIAYARARELGEDVIAEECLAIIDEEPERIVGDSGNRIDPGDVANRKLRYEGRLKLLAKWNPKRWGDKLDVTSDGEKIVPTETEAAVRLAKLVDKYASQDAE